MQRAHPDIEHPTICVLQSVAEEYSILNAPRPFKNPYYKRDAKRSRSMKQIMATERERVDTLAKEKREKRAARRAALEAQGDPSAMLVDEEDNVNGEEVVTCAYPGSAPWLTSANTDVRRVAAGRCIRRSTSFSRTAKEVLRRHRTDSMSSSLTPAHL